MIYVAYEASCNDDDSNAHNRDDADERRENVVQLVCPQRDGEHLEQVERRDDLRRDETKHIVQC